MIIRIYRVWKLHGEEGYEQYKSQADFSYEELELKLKEKYVDFVFGENREIEILEYTDSGRVKKVKIGNKNLSGVELRSLLGLKSTNFIITKGEKVSFEVIGYGHGVRNEPNRCRCTCKTRI